VIRWCSYCQRFLGEVPPLDSYDLTHGICRVCRERETFHDQEALERLDPVKRFFAEIKVLALSGAPFAPRDLLEQSRRLGIAPLDFLMGILQPLLYEIGERWARGEVTVVTEHRFTALTAAFIQLAEIGLQAPPASDARVVLLSAHENYHTLGIQIASAYLHLSGVACEAIYPSLPLAEAIALVRRRRPLVLGFSVAAPAQMQYVHDIVREVPSHGVRLPRILVGGSLVRTGRLPDPGWPIEVVQDLRDLRFD